ncbi:HmuY family protein [Nitrospina sp. 32_T5]|uniref:HmuY family protein n=1 Tax=unclassified Nitrospina TaxID=2638683 RepID=UPI003F96C07B
MSEPFNTPVQENEPVSPEARKKHKLWRNLFILNLCVTLLLIGIWWLPVKFAEINKTMDEPSMEATKKKGPANVGGTLKTEVIPESHLLKSRVVVVDARDEQTWRYYDFSRGGPVEIHDRSSLEWDLAFRRGKIISNGGMTNKIGKAGLMDMGEVSYDAVEDVPLDREFIQDKATQTEPENPVLAQWYKYNYITHKLTARKNIYILRTAEGNYAKIQFQNFYCADKQPGCIQMKYAYQPNGSPNFLKNSGSFSTTSVLETPKM